jgi:hypothetical protein
MIKALATMKGGRRGLLFGLSRVNMEKLLAGLPIRVDTEDMGMKGGPMVYIVGAETEEGLAEELVAAGLIEPSHIRRSDTEDHG